MTKQNDRREVGYILLQECEVLCVGAIKSDQAAKCSAKAASTLWYEVDLCPTTAKDQKENPRLPDDGCDLILQPCLSTTDNSEGNNLSWTNANAIIPFNGLISEIPIDQPRESTKIDASSAAVLQKRRSDASLLAGLAVEINDQARQFQQEASRYDGINPELGEGLHLRHLQMENAQIMFWGNDEVGNSQSESNFRKDLDAGPQSTNDTSGECDSSVLTRRKASLLMTFSLPNQACSNKTNFPSEERLSDVRSKTSTGGNKAKMLSSAYQLIASIIRCDWSHLDSTMKLLEQNALSTTMVTSVSGGRANSIGTPRFFPESLNVEELYTRISGASKHFNGEKHQLSKGHHSNAPADNSNGGNETFIVPKSCNSPQTHATKPADFLDLPCDIIATSIATYLRSKSLHSLRITCWKVYISLREVVPGLKLKLFQHQVRSLEWMELRERQCITEGELLCKHRERISSGCEVVCGGDYHRAVSGGATVLLVPRPNIIDGQLSHSRIYRFDLDSGSEVDCASERKTACARGGLLCDDPGLGKTITIISLILRSFGLSTDSNSNEEPEQGGNDESLFYLYWRSSFLTDHVQRVPAIMRLINSIIKSDKESGWFVPPIDQFLQDCPDYFDVISTPICLQDIRMKYSKSDCRDFKAFEADVTTCFLNAMKYNPPDHFVHQAAQRLLKNFEAILTDFKRDQINIASKSMHRYRSAKEPSARSVVDAFESKKRSDLQKSLVSSSSTLLVVPASLLNHWQEQIILHVDFGYLSEPGLHSPFIYYHTSKRNIDIANNKVQSLDLNLVTNPIIFIDDGSKRPPPASVLARFSIVLTSHNRFTGEWKNGSLEQEIRASKRGAGNSGIYWGDDEPEASSLLKVSWLRVIVDEGHVMGKSTSNLIQFASWLTSERTWAMTGTPTQQIATHNGLKNMYHLTNFLKHDFFNRKLGREKCWNDLISSVWQLGYLASFFRLQHLLCYLMVRHTKADLAEIPQPVYKSTQIKLSQSETTTYNTIVSGIRTNLITTSMKGKTSGWQDSLLNPRQYRHASGALTNLRIACCGGTQILPEILQKHWNETLVMCREIHNLDEVKVQLVNNFISRAQSAELSGCHSCGIQLQTLLVVPCGHLVCTECIDSKTTTCHVCHKTFDADDFQKLQPGFNLQFCLELQREKDEREKQQALDRAISESTRPEIEIDEARDIGGNRPNDALIRSHRRGESCVYTSSPRDGRCRICREEHFDCNFMNREQKCSVCFKNAEQCPSYASKSCYMIDKLLQLRSHNYGAKECNVSPMALRAFANGGIYSRHRPLKAIIFSQFRSCYEYLGDRLIRRFGGACVADYSYNRTRSSELKKFIYDPDCFVMLLSKPGSVGLDLSFVTHIFFLDSIYDKSLEEQVVARSYRMGATGPVTVEQLIAKDSIEETIVQINSMHRANVENSSENHAKVHRLLKGARLIKLHLEQKKRKHDKEHEEHLQKAPKLGSVRFNV